MQVFRTAKPTGFAYLLPAMLHYDDLTCEFRTLAGSAFAGLVSEFGFSGPSRVPFGVRFVRRTLAIDIIQTYEPEFLFQVIFQLKRSWGRKHIVTLDRLIWAAGVLVEELGLPSFMRDREQLALYLPTWYAALVEYAERVLSGDDEHLIKIRVSPIVQQKMIRNDRIQKLSERAYEAWTKRDFERMLKLLEELQGLNVRLSRLQEERMEYARRVPKS